MRVNHWMTEAARDQNALLLAESERLRDQLLQLRTDVVADLSRSR